MADEEVKDEKEKKGLPVKMIGIVVVLVLLIGNGAFFFFKAGAPAKGTEGVESTEVVEEEDPEEGGTIYALEPFIVNLADTMELRYLKITIKLDLLRPQYAEDLERKTAQIRDSILILLSSKTSSIVRTVGGKMELRDEIVQRVNGVFEENKVLTAYFIEFVTQ